MSAHWPASTIEMRSIEKLVPFARNSRTHTEAQIAQVAAAMREWGWTNPVLVDEHGTILAGHCRIAAARMLDIEQIPTMVAHGWSDAQKRAYVIADNKLALNAGWDAEALKLELQELDSAAFKLDLLGFDLGELSLAMAESPVPEGLTDPDQIPEPPSAPVTTLGDVWVLGHHRIVCGDSTDADVVAKCLNGVVPHLMVTDPPYGVEYDANWRNEAARTSRGMGNRAIGAGAVGKVLNDDQADWREAWSLFPGDVAYVWHAGVQAGIVADSLGATGFHIRSQIIWAKQQFAISRGDYHWQHEPCWYAVRKGKTGHYAGGRKQSTLWHIDKPQKSETGHSTQKPVECMKRPIENNSSPGQAVYEPFSGSGTTIIAGEMTGRSIHAIELKPAYVDVAVKRWQDFTGQSAVLENDGRTYHEVSDGIARTPAEAHPA